MPRIVVLAPLVLLLATACVSPDRPSPGRGPAQADERTGSSRPSTQGAGGFPLAARLVDQGEYERALPILRCVAGQGPGFEIAQYLAGFSALQLADQPETPDILRDELRLEGLDRLVSAAEAGWPSAQVALVEHLARVESDTALEQAGYWAAVYRRNPRERALGIDRLDQAIELALVERLGPRADEAEHAAETFIVEPLTAVETPAHCQRFLERRGSGGQEFRRQRGGRGGRGPGTGRGGVIDTF